MCAWRLGVGRAHEYARDASVGCPTAVTVKSHVVLGHGSGGRLSAALMRDIFLPAFGNPVLNELNDQAAVRMAPGRVAFSTDSYVVKPLFFPGGSIGELAVYGTVNDLAVGGAEPQYLSAAFILEEGLELETLRRVVEQMAVAARRAGVSIVTGDTKVVEKGEWGPDFYHDGGDWGDTGWAGAGAAVCARGRQDFVEWPDWRAWRDDSGAAGGAGGVG
jgi:hypothetical protein